MRIFIVIEYGRGVSLEDLRFWCVGWVFLGGRYFCIRLGWDVGWTRRGGRERKGSLVNFNFF